MDVGAACYEYSGNGGSTWSGWLSASSAGSDGATSYQAVTAGSVPFNKDSGTQNKIKFKVDDFVGNTCESDAYAVNIDAADPTAPMIPSPTNPDGGVGATEMFKADGYVRQITTKNGG